MRTIKIMNREKTTAIINKIKEMKIKGTVTVS